MDLKTTFDFSFDEDAVSPVVGVILMVAITVILAAVIGTFVLDLGGQVQQNAQAGVTFDEVEGTSVTVQLNSVQSADTIYVTDGAGGEAELFNESDGLGVGNTVEAGPDGSLTYTSGNTVSVIGVLDGSESVIQTHEMA